MRADRVPVVGRQQVEGLAHGMDGRAQRSEQRGGEADVVQCDVAGQPLTQRRREHLLGRMHGGRIQPGQRAHDHLVTRAEVRRRELRHEADRLATERLGSTRVQRGQFGEQLVGDRADCTGHAVDSDEPRKRGVGQPVNCSASTRSLASRSGLGQRTSVAQPSFSNVQMTRADVSS